MIERKNGLSIKTNAAMLVKGCASSACNDFNTKTLLKPRYFLPFTGFRTLKLHIKVSSIVIIAPALSNSPQ